MVRSASLRTFTATVVLGGLGLAWAAFAFTRLLESWRVGPAESQHTLVLLGQRFGYPAANAGAILVAVFAGLGLAVVVAGARAGARQLRANRRLRMALRVHPSIECRGAQVIESERPQAFCAGLLRPRVYVSSGALALLDAAELAAVLAHEHHHAMRRDPLRLACVRTLADALFFLPGLRGLVERRYALAEIDADEAAVRAAGGDRTALASAMLAFSHVDGSAAVGLDPERVDLLLDRRSGPRFPLMRCLGICLWLAALTAAVQLAAHFASGSATLALPFVSAQPCVVVLAIVPALVGVTGVIYVRPMFNH